MSGQDEVTGWTTGPLPHALEQIALRIFAREFPMAAWGDPVFSVERNDCRRFALQLRVELIKADRWTLNTAADQLAAQTEHLIFGDRPLGKTIRHEVECYAASYISDLATAFVNRLFWPKDIEANNLEVEQERNRG